VSNLPIGTSSSPSSQAATVRVWDLPLRICHWALAASVLVAWFSANVYDAVHEASGYLVMGLVAFRLVWGFAGTPHARFAQFVRPPGVVLRYLRDLAFGRVTRHLGHNPAGAAMTLLLLALLTISTISGWMQLTQRFFGVTWVELVHAYASNLVLVVAIVHVLGVLLMCALQKENLVRAMITGRKAVQADASASSETA
jgi:cytochrome b